MQKVGLFSAGLRLTLTMFAKYALTTGFEFPGKLPTLPFNDLANSSKRSASNRVFPLVIYTNHATL
jgi:hypothetical protein